MKILMLGCKEYPYGTSSAYEKFSGGGVARYIISLSKELASKGHEVHLIVRKFPMQEDYEFFEGMHIHRIKTTGHKYFMLASFAFKSYKKSKELFKKYGPFDIVHCHNPFVSYAARNFSAKKIATIHGIASTQVAAFGQKAVKLLHFLEKNSYPKFDRTVFLHEKDYDKFCSIYGPLNNHSIIYSGIDFKDKSKIKKEAHDGFNVLFAGRLERVKGIVNLVHSYPMLKEFNAATVAKTVATDKNKKNNDIHYVKKDNDIRYVIIGDGTKRDEIQSFIKDNALEKDVLMKGFQKDIDTFLASADLLILPSYSEGFPMTILEAASHKVPCLINNFDIPFSKECLFIMNDNDPSTIAENISKISKEKLLLKKKADKAYSELKQFSLENMAKNYDKLYRQI